MSANAFTMRPVRDEVIDLTADDDDDTLNVPITTSHNTPGFVRPPPSARPPSSRPADWFTPPSIPLQHSAGVFTSLRAPEPQQQGRPTKRQRIESKREALKICLDRQVFPHLDRATEELDNAIYDVDRLGAAVTRQVVDEEFKRHFYDGNGKVPGDAEALMAVRIRRCVLELMVGPEFRRPPPSPVLPSIEKVEIHDDAEDYDVEIDEGAEDYDDEDGGDGDDDDDDDAGFDSDEHRPKARTPPPSHKTTLITPQRLRARAKAGQWQSGRAYESKRESTPLATQSQWFKLPSRPYIQADVRQRIVSSSGKRLLRLESAKLFPPSIPFHVDFGDLEVRYLQRVARALCGRPLTKPKTALDDLRHILKKTKNPDMKSRITAAHRQGYSGHDRPPSFIRRRTVDDINNFLDDLYLKKHSIETKSLFIERDDVVARSDIARANRVPALLLTREIAGNHPGFATGRSYKNFTTAFKSNKEDYLEPKVEWTNCAGDLMTLSWLSNAHFICGATTHSDSHNQQYNKPGNLLLGSARSNTLRAYPDHRVVRPIVSHGENAQESMRESQDPWLYTSVVSSDYEPSTGLAFTSSFDKTVKIWKLDRDGDSMTAVGTWEHGGRVNFVIASKDRIATAADVPTEAVRVYYLDASERNTPEDISSTRFDSYSCTRVHDEDYVPSDKWAYFPAAIQWGLAPTVRHLLLIGYSPRSTGGEDHEIPEDKRDTGELCLWNTTTKTQVKVNSAKTQNVFEVAWHPSRGSFIAATSSASQTLEKVDDHIRTQIRIFEPNPETEQYGAIKTLDCAAVDINELSIKPNSILYSYVTASCTDGKVYVWDTSASDEPMCVLEHGDPVEELVGDREQEDVGVKFTAWGTTTDRLYTGSSDGVVKVWNIRQGTHVKDLIEVAAPITVGAFSPDFTKLAIGDGSGRVYLLALEGEDEAVSSSFVNLQLNGKQRAIRRPRPFIPHPELPPPGGPRLATGQTKAREYLQNAELERHADATVGVMQGANYARTGLFRAEAHLAGDVNAPLLGSFENQQQANQKFSRAQRFPRQGRTPIASAAEVEEAEEEERSRAFRAFHGQNVSLDLMIDPATRLGLTAEGAELEPSPVDLDYESNVDDDDEDDGGEGDRWGSLV